jgi:hypothetical protein
MPTIEIDDGYLQCCNNERTQSGANHYENFRAYDRRASAQTLTLAMEADTVSYLSY